ncbi:MAG: sensor histidine kinase [Thermoanaerobaculales bacterium]
MTAVQRVALLVASATFATAIVVVGVAEWHDRALRRDEQQRHLVELASTLTPRVAELLARPRAELWQAVRRWETASGYRITVIAADGQVVVDTSTVPDLVRQMENHGGRLEVVAAREQGNGLSRRRSATTNRVTTYAASRVGVAENPVGFVRVAWEEPPVAFPLGGVLIALGTTLVAGLVTRAWALRWQRGVARYLSAWTGLSADDPAETLAEEADRYFRQERERLEREVEVVRAALDRVGEGVVLLDRENAVRFSNAAASTLLGADLEIGHPLLEAIRAPEMIAAVHDVLAQGGERHTTVPLADGAELAVRVCAVAHPVLAVAVVVRDVREERQLERSRRALVADLAHELRTPLTVLTGLAEELGEGGGDRELTETLVRQVAKLRAFASELEELARIEAGQLRLEVEEVRVDGVITQVLADLGGVAEAAGVVLAAQGEPAVLRTDPVRLGQVVGNLVDNGIRYNRRGGHVTVRTVRSDNEVRIEVADDGVGIPAAEIGLVFQRFYRVRRQAESTGGSGLGLAIVKHLTRALGGTVSLISREGRGTTVTLSFPG